MRKTTFIFSHYMTLFFSFRLFVLILFLKPMDEVFQLEVELMKDFQDIQRLFNNFDCYWVKHTFIMIMVGAMYKTCILYTIPALEHVDSRLRVDQIYVMSSLIN